MPLYIEKVEIWSGDTDGSQTHKLTDFERKSSLAPRIQEWNSSNTMGSKCRITGLEKVKMEARTFESARVTRRFSRQVIRTLNKDIKIMTILTDLIKLIFTDRDDEDLWTGQIDKCG